MHKTLRWFIPLAAAAFVAGCSEATSTSGTATNDPECDGTAVYGITVQVEDSVTHAFIGAGAQMITTSTDGTYTDTTSIANTPSSNDFFLASAIEPGTYNLLITLSGYRSWTKSNVVVMANFCDVAPVNLIALMQH